MEALHERCAGLDVHKKTVVACAMWSGPGGAVGTATKAFGTMTRDLEALAAWLAGHGCTRVAMGATGASGKPVYDVLEARGGFEPLVADAEHLRAVPGRQTDVKAAEWIATLLRHGLPRASFIPDREQRERRGLTRYRTAPIRERASEVNRLQETLEAANIEPAAVLADLTGASGQRILDAPTPGRTDPEQLADLAHWRVRKERDALEQAVVGRLDGALRFVVRQQLRHIRELDAQLAACDAEVAARLGPFAAALARLRTIPGLGPRTAEVIRAEVGPDVSRFLTHRHPAAWAGMAPGNNASGGKRRPARACQGRPWLRAARAEAARAASHCKQGYLPAQFRRLAARRGKKRAIVAVGHSILVIAYHVLARGTTFEDLGGLYFDERDRERVKRRAIQRLEGLGFDVPLAQHPKAS